MTENEIETYLLQLENVNLALSDVNCGNRDELNQLRDDLLELISMSQNIGEEDESMNDEEMAENDDSSSNSSTDSEEFGVGSKCRAPFSRFSNSSINLTYHNALVFELDSKQNIDLTEPKVKVMFCNPLTKSMQPCPYFLKGTCNFENSCRFSHGESVPVSQLTDYREPDFENVAKDTLCLVKQEDNLWKLGRITAVSREEESAAVSMLDTNEEIQAPFSTLLPISDKDKESPVSSSNLVDDVEEDGPFDDSVIRKQIRHHAWRCDTLGGWEKHTKGVASKLMVKMGFVPGQGLGKDNDGRLEPIEAKILPKGKSLDKCLEKSSKDPLKVIKDKKRKEKLKERKRIKKGLQNTDFPSTSNSNVFDIINDKLNGSSLKLDKSVPTRIVSEKFSETNDKDLNIKLLRLQENIRAEERNSCRYKNGVERNEKCDKFASARVKTKLKESDNRLEELKTQEKILLNEIANRKNHKKFVQF